MSNRKYKKNISKCSDMTLLRVQARSKTCVEYEINKSDPCISNRALKFPSISIQTASSIMLQNKHLNCNKIAQRLTSTTGIKSEIKLRRNIIKRVCMYYNLVRPTIFVYVQYTLCYKNFNACLTINGLRFPNRSISKSYRWKYTVIVINHIRHGIICT